MFTQNSLTLSFLRTSRMRYTAIFLLIAAILAGFTTACATTAQSASNDPVAAEMAALPSNPGTSPGTVDNSLAVHGSGHEYGAINGVIDPGTSLRANPPPFVYWVIGQMVVRRSELGPLNDLVSNPVVDVVVDPPQALGSGRDFGAIYSGVDPGKNLCVTQPKLTFTFNEITVVRRSDLAH